MLTHTVLYAMPYITLLVGLSLVDLNVCASFDFLSLQTDTLLEEQAAAVVLVLFTVENNCGAQ